MVDFEDKSMYEEIGLRYDEIQALFEEIKNRYGSIINRFDGVDSAIAEQSAIVN